MLAVVAQACSKFKRHASQLSSMGKMIVLVVIVPVAIALFAIAMEKLESGALDK